MKKLLIFRPFLAALFVLTISPLFAEIIQINFENDGTHQFATNSVSGRPNGIFRFADNESQGFRFSRFGILLKDGAADLGLESLYNQDPNRGYYWGNADETSNYVGYNDNGNPASIERADGSPFSFLGGCFTPANYTDGWVNLIGWVWNDTKEMLIEEYNILFEIEFAKGTYATYYDMSLFTGDENGLADIVKLDIISFNGTYDGEDKYWWRDKEDEEMKKWSTNYQIVMDNLLFRIDNVNPTATVPEPATIAVLGLGMIGLLASRRKRKSAHCQ